MFDMFSDPTVWASVAALTLMEIVLGVDNIIFISILASRLPDAQRGRARMIGLILAGAIRIALIFMIGWIIGLEHPLFKIAAHDVTGRDLILMGGGLFLIYKSTREIHHKLEGPDEAEDAAHAGNGFVRTVVQISLLNLVFSLDSIVTAVGMTEHVVVMIIAVVLSLGFMFVVGRPVGDFVMRHPSVKMLALSFLLLIGFSLAMEAMHFEIPKAYVYSAMAFSIFVEMLNIAAKKRNERKRQQKPVHLRRNVVGMRLRRFDRRLSD